MSDRYQYNNPMKYNHYPKAIKSPDVIVRPDANTLLKKHKEKYNVGAVNLKPANINIEDKIKHQLETPSNIIYNYTLYGGIASAGLVGVYLTGKISKIISKTSK